MKFASLTITDTMGFWDDYLGDYAFNPERSKTFTTWYKLPDDWFSDDALLPDKREALLQHLYGEAWRLGNGDGSRYVILALEDHMLSAAEVAARPWEQARTTYFERADDGTLTKRELGAA